MTMRAWIRSNRRLAATVTSGTVVTALIATVAVISGGYTAQQVELDSGSVWVANADDGLVGRSNTRVLALDTVIEAPTTEASIVQAGSTVLVADRVDARLDVIDPASAEIAESLPLPPDAPAVMLAGDRMVVHSAGTGELWFHSLDQLDTFDAATDAALTFGEDSVAATGPDGTVFVFSRETGSVHRIDPVTETVTASVEVPATDPDTDYQFSAIGDGWALFDPSTARLFLPGGEVDLDDEVATPATARLQSSGQSNGRVHLAHRGGLVSVATDGLGVRVETDSAAGSAIDAIVVDGCLYAAWTGGTVLRDCAGSPAETLTLEQVGGGGSLGFVVNGAHVVLSDAASGRNWAVQDRGQLIDNWTDLVRADDTEQPTVTDADAPPVVEREQRPPVAVDDAFGARPGRTSPMPVLLNDHDPNGDPLVITAFDQLDEGVGRLEPVSQRQMLQLTLTDTVRGVITFGYTISDGRGGTASATVTVTVRAPEENAAPVQQRPTRMTVEAGGRFSTDVLGDWVDPDGDPIYLADAAVAPPDTVSHRPGGILGFVEQGGAGPTRTVALVVSDGTAQAAGTVQVSVHPSAAVPLIAQPFVVLATAGTEVTIDPLAHVEGGSGTIRLNAVPDKSGAVITPSLEKGTFTFRSEEVRTHNLEYVVADSRQTATGVIRVEVQAPPDANARPIAVPRTVFIHTLSSESIDLTATAIDPAGGVLLVTGVLDVPVDRGVRAEVLEQRNVRITLTAPLDPAIATFSYRVTNGLAESVGLITVVQIERPPRLQPPIAVDDAVNVRVGAAVDIPVLDNDVHPDGEQLTVVPELVRDVPSGGGLLFTSGNRLRYLAPQTPGVYTAEYAIIGPAGQTAQAQVTITVREAIAETNNAPVPRTLTARVFAGDRVRIDVPLATIDPDGDRVTLIGLETSPEKGTVVATEADGFVYQAGGYSAGTDTFTYTVIDGLGARATGVVRVGIAPPLDVLPNPIAVDDEVRIRPGASVLVRVLENDADPTGSELTVVAAEPNDERTVVEIVDDTMLRVTPPNEAGRHGVVVTIQNRYGGQSSNFLTVIVEADAPLARPIARDVVLSLSDVLDRPTVDVDVLDEVFFADGDVHSLGLSLVPGFDQGAQITADRRIRVSVGDASQIIPFAVSHPDDSSVRATAFIRVPGFDDALPQLDRTAPPLTVVSEQTLRIDINDHVIAVGGHPVRLTDRATARATNANGADLVVDDDTLRFTSADLYFGPASITFEVTDGASASDPTGRRATIVLPITVTPRENQPPVFVGGQVDFEPGETREFDLLRLTTYPYPDDLDELAYTVLEPQPTGFSWQLEGALLRVTADASVPKGTTAALSIGVRDAATTGTSGRLRLQVVPSTRPLARPAADSAIAQRGTTTVIDVLANDSATNPFPGQPLTVTAIRGADGASLPAGVQISPSTDRSRLTVTIATTAVPGDVNLQYQVADATGDPERRVWGSVTVSIQDVPDAPVAPERAPGGVEEGQLTLRLVAPQFNNSPIVRYEVFSDSHGTYRHDCGLQLRCALTDLVPGQPYVFRAVAINALGASAASAPSAALIADYLPAAPVEVRAVPTNDAPAGGSVQISWSAIPDPNPGSPVAQQVVTVIGADGSSLTRELGRSATGLALTLTPDVEYTVTVHARNAAQVGDADWRRTSTTVRPVGHPGSTTVQAAVLADGSGDIVVTWTPSSPNGAGGVTYSVGRVAAGASVPSTCVTGPGKPAQRSPDSVASGWADTATVDGAQYRYIVYADNGYYCTPTASGPVEAKQPPGAASASVSVEARDTTGRFDLRVSGLTVTTGTAVRYEASLGGGAWTPVTNGAWVTSGADASVYGVPQQVRVRGCRDTGADFCGPASEPMQATPVNTRVTAIVSCVPDALPEAAAPINAGAPDAVTYAFSYDTMPNGSFTAFSYTALEPVPSDATQVRVRATVTVGSEVYTDPHYGGEFECQ